MPLRPALEPGIDSPAGAGVRKKENRGNKVKVGPDRSPAWLFSKLQTWPVGLQGVGKQNQRKTREAEAEAGRRRMNFLPGGERRRAMKCPSSSSILK